MEVIYLKRGERPPKGEPYMLIICASRYGADEMASDSINTTIRIRPKRLAKTLADLERGRTHKVYVRGAPSSEPNLLPR